MYNANVFNVLIASPGDVQVEREIVREVVHEWNATNSRSRKIVLQPVGWETHSHPAMGDRAQGILNHQILADADLLVAIFWSRLGTPTGEAPGGSVEELDRHMKAGKPAMVYFSDAPGSLEMGASESYKALVEFRDFWCKPRGLLESYKSYEAFKEKFRRQLSTKVNETPYFVSRAETIAWALPMPVQQQPSLSPDAKLLLLQGAEEKTGLIIARSDISNGFQIWANRKPFVEAGNAAPKRWGKPSWRNYRPQALSKTKAVRVFTASLMTDTKLWMRCVNLIALRCGTPGTCARKMLAPHSDNLTPSDDRHAARHPLRLTRPGVTDALSQSSTERPADAR